MSSFLFYLDENFISYFYQRFKFKIFNLCKNSLKHEQLLFLICSYELIQF